MSNEVAHKRWWETFDVICGLPFLGAVALELAVPRALSPGVSGPVVIGIGVTLVILGTTLVVLARRELARHGQPTDPGRPTGMVVRSGVFSISRNPLYLGGFCFLIGVALAFDLFWALVTLPLTLSACHFMLIVAEERYLATRFGAEYQSYAASVRRWIGRTRRYA